LRAPERPLRNHGSQLLARQPHESRLVLAQDPKPGAQLARQSGLGHGRPEHAAAFAPEQLSLEVHAAGDAAFRRKQQVVLVRLQYRVGKIARRVSAITVDDDHALDVARPDTVDFVAVACDDQLHRLPAGVQLRLHGRTVALQLSPRCDE
jgi:hypothetical protein